MTVYILDVTMSTLRHNPAFDASLWAMMTPLRVRVYTSGCLSTDTAGQRSAVLVAIIFVICVSTIALIHLHGTGTPARGQ